MKIFILDNYNSFNRKLLNVPNLIEMEKHKDVKIIVTCSTNYITEVGIYNCF